MAFPALGVVASLEAEVSDKCVKVWLKKESLTEYAALTEPPEAYSSGGE